MPGFDEPMGLEEFFGVMQESENADDDRSGDDEVESDGEENDGTRLENADEGSQNDEGFLVVKGLSELQADHLLLAENDVNLQGLKKVDSQALEEDDIQSSEAWNLSCEANKHFLENRTSHTASLVWPPMLLVCIHGIEAKEEALSGVRELLVSKGLQADVMTLTEFVCSEGNTFYDLFVLPPSGLSFAAAKAVDRISRMTRTCCYPSLQDMVDIRSTRVPEFSRRFIPNLRYHGVDRPAWSNLEVDLLSEDGMRVGQGVCRKIEPNDCVNGEVLGDVHVGVKVLHIFEELIPFDWEGTVCRWEITNVLHDGVSLFERLRQHSCSGVPVSFYFEDIQDGLNVQEAQEVLKDQFLTSVAPWISSCKVDGGFHSLSAECSKICKDTFHNIKKNASKTFAKNDFEEQ